MTIHGTSSPCSIVVAASSAFQKKRPMYFLVRKDEAQAEILILKKMLNQIASDYSGRLAEFENFDSNRSIFWLKQELAINTLEKQIEIVSSLAKKLHSETNEVAGMANKRIGQWKIQNWLEDNKILPIRI
jgi:hypothetical protein